MANEQRWIVSEPLGLLLQVSRAFFLAPICFVVTRTATFVYVSRNLFLLNLLIVTITHLFTIYSLYIWIPEVKKENYNDIILKLFHVSNIMVFVSFAVLNSDRRMRTYMTCFTSVKKVIKILHNTEETNIKKWHVFIILFGSLGGANLVVMLSSLMPSACEGFFGLITEHNITLCIMYNESTIFNQFAFNCLTLLYMLEFTMAGIYQQQFVYFALHINFALKLIQEQLQEELAKMIINDGKQRGVVTRRRLNIPLESINKVIDMLGRTDIFLPNLTHTRRHDMAQRIRQINNCYVSTCDALRDLNASDNVLLFLHIIYISITMMLTSYDIIKLLQQDDSSLILKLLIHCVQFVLLIMQIIMLIEPCHRACKKIAYIRLLVCEVMCYISSTRDPIHKEIQAFSNQLALNNISYTTLGIWNIRRPLITSIIGVVTTILIMIFEF